MWKFDKTQAEKPSEPQRNEVSKVYKERLKPISKDKNVAAIIEKMANHLERKNNIQFEIDDKHQEIEVLKDQAKSLADQYKFDLNRETMRAKAEVENEVKIIESERRALVIIYYNSINNWKIELSPEEVQILEKAYEPIGVKERELFTELQKKAEEYIKAFAAFKKEYDSNVNLHNTLVGVIESSANPISFNLNRVKEYELLELRSQVKNLG
jgi:hypothetical protein